MPKVIAAGRIVKLNDDGEAVYPRYAGMVGRLEGYNRPGVARVIFEAAIAPVIIDASFLIKAHQQKMAASRTERNERIIKYRKIIRRAFDVVRHDPRHQAQKDIFLSALGGHIKIGDDLLAEAQDIIDTAEITEPQLSK